MLSQNSITVLPANRGRVVMVVCIFALMIAFASMQTCVIMSLKRETSDLKESIIKELSEMRQDAAERQSTLRVDLTRVNATVKEACDDRQ